MFCTVLQKKAQLQVVQFIVMHLLFLMGKKCDITITIESMGGRGTRIPHEFQIMRHIWCETLTCVCNGALCDCTWRGVLAPLMRDILWRGSGLFNAVVVVAVTAGIVGFVLEATLATPLPWTLFDAEGGSNGGGGDESTFRDCSCCCCNSRCCCWRCVTYRPQ